MLEEDWEGLVAAEIWEGSHCLVRVVEVVRKYCCR